MNLKAPNRSEDAQSDIVAEFALFSDWSERYQYLIDLGRKLPEFPTQFMTDAHKVQGCQSQVWLVSQGDAQQLNFQATSDSAIVSGLIALLLRTYSGLSAQDILDTEPRFIDAMGLSAHLSPTRSNGLAALLNAIKTHARLVLVER